MMGDDRYGTTMDDHESYGHAAKTGTGIGFIIFGALLWVITTSLVSQCRADLSILTGGSGTCSGLPRVRLPPPVHPDDLQRHPGWHWRADAAVRETPPLERGWLAGFPTPTPGLCSRTSQSATQLDPPGLVTQGGSLC